ncbi:MAG: hypothetical protein UZ03_NOB001000569 [Nitrospira sp. OLB3]|nr:MAG: hypothetical protein UZ03_NOB001000569 [Nitrospira sp. OLB3]
MYARAGIPAAMGPMAQLGLLRLDGAECRFLLGLFLPVELHPLIGLQDRLRPGTGLQADHRQKQGRKGVSPPGHAHTSPMSSMLVFAS